MQAWLRWGRGSAFAEPPCSPLWLSKGPKRQGLPSAGLETCQPSLLAGGGGGGNVLVHCGPWYGKTQLTSLAEEVALAVLAMHDKQPESNVPLLRGQTTAFGSLGVTG